MKNINFNLEGFCKRSGAKVSHKLGIFGLGQYGGKIANLFAGLIDDSRRNYYDVMAVNSFWGDMEPLKNIANERKYALVGVEGGCGRKPELAKQALQNKINQAKLMEMTKKYLSNKDMYIVTGGLGGGTATGSITTSIKVVHAAINIPLIKNNLRPKPIGAIVTLPRKTDPPVEKKNALKAIKELESLMESKTTNFKFIIYVDNEKAFRDYRELKANKSTEFESWMDYSNYQVVSTLHEINIATSFSSDKAFDPQDLKNVFEEWEGSMTFGKIKFPSSDIKNSDELVQKAIHTFHEGNVLANGFDLKKSRTAGVLIVKPSIDRIVTANSLDDVEVRMAEEMPGALYRPTGYIDWNNPKDTIIYTIAKVAEMPKRARTELIEEYNKSLSSIKNSIQNDKAQAQFEDVDDSVFGESKKLEVDFDPFSETVVQISKDEELDFNPFEEM